jgi:hypothetical protein
VAAGDALRSGEEGRERKVNVALRQPVMSLEEFLAWGCLEDNRWKWCSGCYAPASSDRSDRQEIDVEFPLADANAGLELGTQPG